MTRAIQPHRSQEIMGLKAAYSQARASAAQEQAGLAQATISYKNSLETANRYQKVLGQGFVTLQEAGDRQAEVDRNQALLLAAQQRLQASQLGTEQAQQRLLLAQAGGSREEIEIARASSQEINGIIAQVQAQIDQTAIVAPVAGRILKRSVHLGEISSPSQTMFTLAREGQLELRADIAQVELTRLKPRMAVEVSLGESTVQGKVWTISPQVDVQSRLGTVRISLPASSSLRPGMFSEARIRMGERQALTVPSQAVLGEGGDYYVYRLEGVRDRSKRSTKRSFDMIHPKGICT